MLLSDEIKLMLLSEQNIKIRLKNGKKEVHVFGKDFNDEDFNIIEILTKQIGAQKTKKNQKKEVHVFGKDFNDVDYQTSTPPHH